MQNFYKTFFVFILLGLFHSGMAQVESVPMPLGHKTYFADVYVGSQVSGIRKEDYFAANFAPYFQIGLGKWIVPSLALSINYHGPYFNYISDNFKHRYHYVSGELLYNFNSLFNYQSKYFNLYGVVGSGLFRNEFKKQNNVCAVAGFVNEIKLNRGWGVKLKSTTIMGWAIYQADEDAITSYSVGLSKMF